MLTLKQSLFYALYSANAKWGEEMIEQIKEVKHCE